MDGENRIPPALIAAIVFVVLAVGAVGYYFGRFGGSRRIPREGNVEVAAPAAPAPAVVEYVPTPVDIPPTVTPPIPVVIEKGRRSSTMVERSSQIVVPVPPAPTAIARPTAIEFQMAPTAQRRIVIEVRPTSTPPPEIEPPPPLETPVPTSAEPPEEETPEPEPTARRPVSSVRFATIRAPASLLPSGDDQRGGKRVGFPAAAPLAALGRRISCSSDRLLTQATILRRD
jgi:hypothetical protein